MTTDNYKVLALGDFTNYKYHPFQDVATELQGLLAAERMEVRCSEDRDQLHMENLASYDVCFSYVDAFDQFLTPRQMGGLLQFVASGKGLLGVHCGVSCQNTEYRYLLGARFTEHPPYQELDFRITDPEHPLTANVSDFRQEDELYFCEFTQPTDMHVFMECRFEGHSYPAGWTHTFGLGRVVYLAPGHSVASFRNEAFRRLIVNSVLWTGMNCA